MGRAPEVCSDRVPRGPEPAQAHEQQCPILRLFRFRLDGSDVLESSVIDKVLAEALARGGDLAEIFVEDRRATAYGLEDSKVEDVASGRDRGAGIRVISGEKAAYAYTNVLTQESLLETAKVARAGMDSPASKPADLTRRDPEFVHDVRTDPFEVGALDKVDALMRADDAARKCGASVRQVIASYADVRQNVLIANSEGLLTQDSRTRVRFVVRVVASENGEIATGFDGPGHSGGFELLDKHRPEEVATRAARKAITMLKARPSPAGEFPVVLAPGTGGVLIHEACGHGLEADTLVKEASVYANKQGHRFGKDIVTIVDDATESGAWGSFGVDDEGTPAQRTVLFENGVLMGHMSDLRSAKSIGAPPTGNGRRQSYAHLPIVRMTNTDLLPGSSSARDIFASVQRGVFAATFAGGQVNPATGDFVFGMAEAYMIENGEVSYPIKGATLIGNGPQVLAVIDAVGSDQGRNEGVCGKDGQHAPVTNGMATVLLGKMTVGGTEA